MSHHSNQPNIVEIDRRTFGDDAFFGGVRPRIDFENVASFLDERPLARIELVQIDDPPFRVQIVFNHRVQIIVPVIDSNR